VREEIFVIVRHFAYDFVNQSIDNNPFQTREPNIAGNTRIRLRNAKS
jgi:hypothetical protein